MLCMAPEKYLYADIGRLDMPMLPERSQRILMHRGRQETPGNQHPSSHRRSHGSRQAASQRGQHWQNVARHSRIFLKANGTEHQLTLHPHRCRHYRKTQGAAEDRTGSEIQGNFRAPACLTSCIVHGQPVISKHSRNGRILGICGQCCYQAPVSFPSCPDGPPTYVRALALSKKKSASISRCVGIVASTCVAHVQCPRSRRPDSDWCSRLDNALVSGTLPVTMESTVHLRRSVSHARYSNIGKSIVHACWFHHDHAYHQQHPLDSAFCAGQPGKNR